MLLVTLVACAKRDLKSEMSRVRSWTATTKLAVELRGVRSTNDAVTRQLLQRAVQTHEQEQQALARLAKTDSQRVAVRGLLDSLERGITRLQQVIP
jgi:signal transduction histidine kinase